MIPFFLRNKKEEVKLTQELMPENPASKWQKQAMTPQSLLPETTLFLLQWMLLLGEEWKVGPG